MSNENGKNFNFFAIRELQGNNKTCILNAKIGWETAGRNDF
jgi:hypothetical protein